MSSEIFIANTDAEIESCFPAFSVLRPHIARADFVRQVRRQQAQGYAIVAIREDGLVKSAAGFRCAEFLAWGKVLYIDDLTTLPEQRSRGFAGRLLDWLIAHANQQRCDAVHLDSGYTRYAAHRLYMDKGLQLSSHHFTLSVPPEA